MLSRSLVMMASSDDSTTASSRRAARSASTRSLMSRAILDAPMTTPWSSSTGETVSEIGRNVPSFRMPHRFEMGDPLALANAIQHRVFFALPIGRDDHPDGAADRFLRGVAEHAFRGAVPGSDGAVQILADDRVVGGFDDADEVAEVEGTERLCHTQRYGRASKLEQSQDACDLNTRVYPSGPNLRWTANASYTVELQLDTRRRQLADDGGLRLDDVMFDRELNQLRGGLEVELVHDAVLVEGDRARRDVQDARDLLHRVPFGEQLNHFTLPRGEVRGSAIGVRAQHHRSDQPFGDERGDIGPALHDLADRHQQLRRRGSFQQVP